MSIKKDKLIEDLKRDIIKAEKKSKKVMLSFTENEFASLQNTATKLNTSVPNLIRKTINLTGITSEEK